VCAHCPRLDDRRLRRRHSAASAAAPRAKWTVMLYISGDNNLEDYVVKDLELSLHTNWDEFLGAFVP